MMKGIQFLTDEEGKLTAVLISLEEWGDVWADFYNVMVAEARKDEDTVPWEELKAEMESETEVGGSLPH